MRRPLFCLSEMAEHAWRGTRGLSRASDVPSSELLVWLSLSCVIKIRGALEGVSNARADVFRAHMTFEFGLLHELGGLFARATEQERPAGGVQRVGQVADGAKTGGVDGRHVAEAQDYDGRQGIDLAENFREFVGCAEQEWSVDAEDRCVRRDVFSLQD